MATDKTQQEGITDRQQIQQALDRIGLVMTLVKETKASVERVSEGVSKLVKADHGAHVQPLIASSCLMARAFEELNEAYLELTEPFFEYPPDERVAAELH